MINIPPLPPRELVLEAGLYTLLPPFAAAVVVLGAVLVEGGKRAGVAGSAFGWLAGLLTGNAVLSFIPLKPGNSTLDWLLWIAIGGTLAGLFIRGISVKAGWAVRIVVAGAAAWLLVPNDLRKLLPWLPFAFGGLVLLGGWASDRLATRQPGVVIPLAWAIFFGGAACVLIHAHSARLMDIACVNMAACLAFAGIAMVCGTDLGGFVTGAAALLPGLLLCGQYETYSEVPWKAFACVAAAPLAMLPLALLKPSAGKGRALLTLLFVSIPVIAGCVLAMRAETISYG